MPDKFQNKYRISSARLQPWDYGWNAPYFVTICCKDREHFFGEIQDGKMCLNDLGILAEKYWYEIPEHFLFVELGNFVVMPNHVHGILEFNKKDEPGNGGSDNVGSDIVQTRRCLVSTVKPNEIMIGKKRYQNQGKNTLSSIIGSYKSIVTKMARNIHADFGWQPRFHEHIIRSNDSFNRISEYILNNPANWKDDKFYD